MSKFVSRCVDSTIAVVVTTIVAIVIMLFSAHVRAQEAPPAPSCQPMSVILERAKAVHFPFGKIRDVAKDKLGDVNEFYESAAGQPENPPWDTATLVDGGNDDGMLFVGHAGKLCKVVYLKDNDWRLLVIVLEGHGV